MIDGSDVIWAYRELLGRDPESEALIERQREAETLGGLVRDVLQSQEYLFRARGKLSEGDVFWAYQTFLARDPEGPQAVQDTLSAGTLGNVILRLLGSDEFRIRNNKIFQLPDQWVIFESSRGFRLWVNTADVAVSWQVMRGTYEPDEVAFISHQLKPGNRALDIGANIGYLTHVMAQSVGETGQVVSFEPHPVLYERLAKSVAENGLSQCKLHNLALGDAEKTGELVFGLDQANFGTSQLLNTAAASGISTCSVPVRRLDDILDPAEHVDFIKIDVEGNEPLVIRGASEFLRAQRPVIMSEILGESLRQMHGMSAMDYVEQVCALGYQCRTLKTGGVIGDHFDQPGMVEFANIVFLPQI
jgi:FkbM family methyltransferase